MDDLTPGEYWMYSRGDKWGRAIITTDRRLLVQQNPPDDDDWCDMAWLAKGAGWEFIPANFSTDPEPRHYPE